MYKLYKQNLLCHNFGWQVKLIKPQIETTQNNLNHIRAKSYIFEKKESRSNLQSLTFFSKLYEQASLQ
jgi:hypothetical protein